MKNLVDLIISLLMSYGDPSYSPCLYRPLQRAYSAAKIKGQILMTTINGWADRQNNDRISDRQINGLDMDEHPLIFSSKQQPTYTRYSTHSRNNNLTELGVAHRHKR